MARVTMLDRAISYLDPEKGLKRIRARAAAEIVVRHYEAAQPGRRTSGWTRSSGDANAVDAPARTYLRDHARDLVRNNAWANRGVSVVANNTVGWGIQPKPVGGDPELVAMWRRWAESTACDAEGRLTFYGLQALTMRTVAESGEAIVRRRPLPSAFSAEIPLQVQVMEGDYIDGTQNNRRGEEGGPIVQGIEFDRYGRRVAYWLFAEHPGSNRLVSAPSQRVPASEVIHVYHPKRAGQSRGVTWLASVILALKDFDAYEDAVLVKQQVASMLMGFIEDGDGAPLPEKVGESSATDPTITNIEPGQINRLGPGEKISFSQPPSAGEDGFSARCLRRVAAGLGVTYEDLTGDYSQVNFSSGRMGRLAHWGNVHDWRWNMLIPQLCDGVWGWAMDAAAAAGRIKDIPRAIWTPPPMPMLEPDKEGLAYGRLVRNGVMTLSEVIREQGGDPVEHLDEMAADMKRLDERGIWLDCDPRRVSQAGLTQERAGAAGGNAAKKAEEKANDEGDGGGQE